MYSNYKLIFEVLTTHFFPLAAVRIGTGGDAPHTGEDLKGPQDQIALGGPKSRLD